MTKPTSKNKEEVDFKSEGRKKLAASTRPYRTILSEFSRLFQRAALKANSQEQAELMSILANAKQQLEKLLIKIDSKD